MIDQNKSINAHSQERTYCSEEEELRRDNVTVTTYGMLNDYIWFKSWSKWFRITTKEGTYDFKWLMNVVSCDYGLFSYEPQTFYEAANVKVWLDS